MVGVDTNALIYWMLSDAPPAARDVSAKAKKRLQELYASNEPLELPYPVVIELANILKNKLGARKATAHLNNLLLDHRFTLLSISPSNMDEALVSSGEKGTGFTDALIRAVLKEHTVTRILTYDSDFAKFGDVEVIQ